MKNTASLAVNLTKLGLVALIGAAPGAASAQNRLVTMRAGGALTPGLPVIGAMPSLGFASASPLTGGLMAPAALTPSEVPLAAAPMASALAPTAAAAQRLQDATRVLAAMPDLGQASLAQARDSGAKLEAALSGEQIAAATGVLPEGSYGTGATPELAAAIVEKAAIIARIRAEIAKVIVGQEEMVDSILISAIAGEHTLIESLPGMAKTLAVKSFAFTVDGPNNRIQGTPDLMPGDITGVEILEEDPNSGVKLWKMVKGPVFTNILLVDEINRMMPKTQAALLEAMAEGRVTINGKTYELSKPFILLATQNPIEQDGVQLLPEAQMDRFMFKVVVDRPTKAELKEIRRRNRQKDKRPKAGVVTNPQELIALRQLAEDIYIDDALDNYIGDIIEATHEPGTYGIDAKQYIETGVSPRASDYFPIAARIHAMMNGRAWVSPSDIKAVAHRILRHRIRLNYQGGSTTTDQIIDQILAKVPVPKPSR